MKMAANRLHETTVTTRMTMVTEETMETNLEATVPMEEEAMGDRRVRLVVMVKQIRRTAMAILRPKTRILTSSKFCSLFEKELKTNFTSVDSSQFLGNEIFGLRFYSWIFIFS